MNEKNTIQPHVSEYEVDSVTMWHESEWTRDYPGVHAFISDFMLYEKQRHPQLLPLIQLLTPAPVREELHHLSTDGEHLFYSPKHIREVLDKYNDDAVRKTLSKQLMHILMHGFLGHFSGYYEDEELAWAIEDLLADRFTTMYLDSEQAADKKNKSQAEPLRFGLRRRIHPQRLSGYRNNGDEHEDDAAEDQNKQKLDSLLEKGMGAYHKIKPMKKSRQFMLEQSRKARSDNHRLWHVGNLKKWEQAMQDILNGLSPEIKEQLRRMSIQAAGNMKQLSPEQLQSVIIVFGVPFDMKNLDLSSLCFVITSVGGAGGGDSYGMIAGNGGGMVVSAKQKSTMCYTDILRELCQEKEQIYEEPDSIDPMFYQYGMDIYEDMPIIEALEENPRPSLENIVFAIDTSGSCVDAAEEFISETCKILSDADEIGHVGSVTMLQCDCQIQRVEEFETGRDMRSQLDRSVEMGGFGGTSFVPVFDWIEERRQQTGQETSALIYLTDGMGEYPSIQPDYPTYFVLTNDQAWTMRALENKPWIRTLKLK